MGMKNPVGVFLIMKSVEGGTLGTVSPIHYSLRMKWAMPDSE